MAIKFSKTSEKYGCFSNFYNCVLTFDGITYKNSEAAWQAQKTIDLEERRKFANLNPSEAKKRGRHVNLRKDWEDVKFYLMIDVCKAKFTQNPELGNILKSTGDEELIENTTGWHDNIWGNCDCPKCINIHGRNMLGKALMKVREEI